MKRTAAFVRAEGLFWPRGWLLAPLYLSTHDRGVRARMARLGASLLLLPWAALLSRHYRRAGTRAFHAILRGMSEDRVHAIGEELAQNVLAPRILAGGRKVLREAHEAGHRVVILSDNIEEVVDPLAATLDDVDEVVCNRLEYRHGHATGNLCHPVLGGRQSPRWLQQYASAEGIDLEHSTAYASHFTDRYLLGGVGRPTAVNPEARLRRTAQEAAWPIADYNQDLSSHALPSAAA